MNVEIVPIEFADKDELLPDLQAYLVIMAPYAGLPPRADGTYEYPGGIDSYWTSDSRWAFWALADGKRAGFAFLRRDVADGPMVMAEFSIKKEFWGTGVSDKLAEQLFARFPGRWDVSMYVENENSVNLWRRATAAYGRPDEEYYDNKLKKRRLKLLFTVP